MIAIDPLSEAILKINENEKKKQAIALIKNKIKFF